MRRWAALLVLCLSIAIGCGAALAQTNPLTGAPSRGAEPAPANPLTGRPAPAQPQAEPEGVFGSLSATIARLQRDTTREMTQQMKAIRDGTNPLALVVAIAIAFLYGVVHAIGPGHGKFVVVSYFLSQESHFWRGLVMGTQIAVLHVVSAVAVVFLVDAVVRQMFGGAPSELRWLALSSYASIAAIGVALFVRALRRWRGQDRGHDHHHHHHHHHHEHDHHPQGSSSGQRLLSLAVGLVPCTGAVLVMIYALANDILVTGLMLASSIAAGMAVTMAGLGVLSIVARRLMMARFAGAEEGGGRLGAAVELIGAVAIVAIGAALFTSALNAPVVLN